MLFNSVEFLYIFLPLTLFAAWFARRLAPRLLLGLMILASLVFYGWNAPETILLIICSTCANYCAGLMVGNTGLSRRRRQAVVAVMVVLNLGSLAYFKYAGFLVGIANSVTDSEWTIGAIVLPLAISFFTFQQIAYLVECLRDGREERGFLDYCFFVTFFPQLIAGPIVKRDELLPQLHAGRLGKATDSDLLVGVVFISFGLFKKTVLADNLAPLANTIFAADPASLSLLDSWIGALAFSLQIYFDFSGYSDIAIGLARLFGLRLPVNFNAPYQATSIIHFWRRWHITLSRFLRDHIYIPLGGSRVALPLVMLNLLIVMALGGLWHGAAWNFVVWGGLHGIYLIIAHGWLRLRGGAADSRAVAVRPEARLGRLSGWGLTYLAVVVAWVFFRADDTVHAVAILTKMSGLGASQSTDGSLAPVSALAYPEIGALGAVVVVCGLHILVLLAPTVQCWLRYRAPVLLSRVDAPAKSGIRVLAGMQLATSPAVAIAIAILGLLGLLAASSPQEFIYFRF